jgi:hypothetical protein
MTDIFFRGGGIIIGVPKINFNLSIWHLAATSYPFLELTTPAVSIKKFIISTTGHSTSWAGGGASN